MSTILLACLLAAVPGCQKTPNPDVRELMNAIESVQQPIHDFRCEFEGSFRFKGELAEDQKGQLGADGVAETFSGVFIWKQGGDTRNDCLHRRIFDNRISREELVVRASEQQAEQYHRLNDAPLGYSVIKSPKEANSWRPDSLGWIFLIDKIKDQLVDPGFDATVSDEVVDGTPLKVLSFALEGRPESLFFRYWIDLRKSGHVVRRETYTRGKIMNSRINIKLTSFKVGDSEVWMPTYGETLGYVAVVDKKPVVVKEATVIDVIYVVDGTMQFNKNPGPEAFRIAYKMGTPISDNLRQLTTEYGKQEINPKPTKAEAEKMLREQLERADQQKSQLVVASLTSEIDWKFWSFTGLAVVLAVVLTVLAFRRFR